MKRVLSGFLNAQLKFVVLKERLEKEPLILSHQFLNLLDEWKKYFSSCTNKWFSIFFTNSIVFIKQKAHKHFSYHLFLLHKNEKYFITDRLIRVYKDLLSDCHENFEMQKKRFFASFNLTTYILLH